MNFYFRVFLASLSMLYLPSTAALDKLDNPSVRDARFMNLYRSAEFQQDRLLSLLDSIEPGGHPNSPICGHLKFPHP